MVNITLITVVFNGEHTLEPTIQSVARLGRRDLQFIVVDGGSTDNTIEIIRKYPIVIDRWVSQPDHGIYDAMNKGWNMADPESSVLFLGSGDQIENMPTEISQDKILYGKVRLGNSGDYFIGEMSPLLKIANTLHHQALLIPKKLSPESPFNIRYKVYADFDFNQRLLKMGTQFEYSDDLVAYALPDGVSAKINLKEMVHIVWKNFGCFWALISLVHGVKHIWLNRKQAKTI